jgi:hypothetical protein
MKKLILLASFLSVHAQAREIEFDSLKERQVIDQKQSTLLMFPELVQTALSSTFLELTPMTEGDASKIWKASPQCENKCEDIDIEFVTVSGKHIALHLKTEINVKDHVLSVIEDPTVGSIEGTRQRLPQLAREAFLRTVRKWPPYPKSEEPTPETVKKFASKWENFRTDQLLIFVGKYAKITRKDVEFLNTPSLVLVGVYDESLVVISRRKP